MSVLDVQRRIIQELRFNIERLQRNLERLEKDYEITKRRRYLKVKRRNRFSQSEKKQEQPKSHGLINEPACFTCVVDMETDSEEDTLDLTSCE